MRSLFGLFALTFAILITASCVSVKEVEYAKAQPLPEDAAPAPIDFRNLKLRLPTGETVGYVSSAYFNLFCFPNPFIYPRDRSDIRTDIDRRDASEAFASAMEAQGYDIVDSLGLETEFDVDEEILRSEYLVSARIIDMKFDGCGKLDNARNINLEGELYIRVKWSLYDALRRNTVYVTTTEGYADRERPNRSGLSLMITSAFEMAAHNFGADPYIRDQIFYGIKPPQDWRKKKRSENRPRRFDPNEEVQINNPPLSITPVDKMTDDIRRTAVRVQGGAGHGSGFFVTKAGHIITNAHVVGEARRVRIVTFGKEKALVAEVLRKDDARDVALLKLDEMPDNLNIQTAPVRTDWPAVSETVYAVGAPQLKRLQDTLTKGIVSAHRHNFKLLGVRQDFIQADVSIHGGNSGGPLFDEFGNIIGQSVAGFFDPGTSNISLNLFNPVGEVLDKLDIEIIESNELAGAEDTQFTPLKLTP